MRKSNNKSLKNAVVAVIVLLLLCVATGLLVTFLKNGTIVGPGDKPDDKTPAEAMSLSFFGKKIETSSGVNIYCGHNDFVVNNATAEWTVSLSVVKDDKFDYIADDKYYSFSYVDYVKGFKVVKRENSFSIVVEKTINEYISELRGTTNIVLPEDLDTSKAEVVLTLTAEDETFKYAVKMDFDHYPVVDVILDNSKVVF